MPGLRAERRTACAKWRSCSSYGVDTSEAALAAQQGRICEPEEVARAALFLASDDASFVNGTHLFVDNGFTAA